MLGVSILSLLVTLGCKMDFSWGEQLRNTGSYPLKLCSYGSFFSEETFSDFAVSLLNCE